MTYCIHDYLPHSMRQNLQRNGRIKIIQIRNKRGRFLKTKYVAEVVDGRATKIHGKVVGGPDFSFYGTIRANQVWVPSPHSKSSHEAYSYAPISAVEEKRVMDAYNGEREFGYRSPFSDGFI